MPPAGIAEAADVFKDCHLGVSLRFPQSTTDQLFHFGADIFDFDTSARNAAFDVMMDGGSICDDGVYDSLIPLA